ncbi:hypothetical protein [Marixanthomonas spongiae]|uniref:Uncharacterized protein n=1 Tax=Marixanthomonas spongiae TaxID=2174845 RepID=A0A2U0I2I0_9FLAO|nr:hypothetical protein [Marixanthomonas spongiae]PVW15309.1 hypothetical protein DDV96_07880 [Marixanthomonas spongiae]
MQNRLEEISIHNLKTISFNSFFALVPEHYDEEIHSDIKASLAKYFLGYHSVDYTKNKFQNTSVNSTDPLNSLLKEITDNVWSFSEELFDKLSKIKLTHRNDITLGITANFHRLQNSYECSVFLIKNKYFFESMSINRMIFEQINYCYNLYDLGQEEFDKANAKILSKKLKSTNINKLKKALPNSQLGSFYSYLSEIAHIDFKQLNNYLHFDKDEDEDEYIVTYKSIFQSIESALVLLKIIDLQSIILEYTLSKFSNVTLEFIEHNNTKIIPCKNRATKKLLILYQKNFFDIIENHPTPETFFRKKKSNDDDLPF